MEKLTTICDFLRLALTKFNQEDLYYGHGTDNAWDDAILLVLGILKLPIDINPMLMNAKLTKEETIKVINGIEKRAKDRVPVPYITNEAWFARMPFYVDERVLIPRSPIAELIENHFNPWVNLEINSILELCTGSGCISIATAKELPHVKIDATDISSDALDVAKINVKKHNLQDNIELIKSDIFKNLQNKKYDLIVTNPPYVDKEDMDSLPNEFHHEPKLGLEAGDDGLLLATEIIQNAKQHLNAGGALIVEVGNSADALMDKFPNLPFTWVEFEKGGSGVFVLQYDELP